MFGFKRGRILERLRPPNANLPTPAGTYPAFVRTDRDPDRVELRLVPNATNVQMHVGNVPEDVIGCFAVGLTSGVNRVDCAACTSRRASPGAPRSSTTWATRPTSITCHDGRAGHSRATGSCEALARAARAGGVLRDEPYVGDIFLLYSNARRRFVHTGIVVGVLDEELVHERDVHVCVTVEGKTNDDGSANGHSTLRKVRTFREADGHRFVRWAELVGRAQAA